MLHLVGSQTESVAASLAGAGEGEAGGGPATAAAKTATIGAVEESASAGVGHGDCELGDLNWQRNGELVNHSWNGESQLQSQSQFESQSLSERPPQEGQLPGTPAGKREADGEEENDAEWETALSLTPLSLQRQSGHLSKLQSTKKHKSPMGRHTVRQHHHPAALCCRHLFVFLLKEVVL